jgi:outer membrane protein assembly factor BamE (lipoprotein component of BamABCDE complex)
MKSSKKLFFLSFIITLLVDTGCASISSADVNNASDIKDKVTVGKVQREIKTGMSGAEVISVLGSPNIVTRDKAKREVWVYDKLSTNFAFSNTEGKMSLSLFNFGKNPDSTGDFISNFVPPVMTGGGSAGYAQNAGASSISQKTLTIIIKLNDDGIVDDFTYHASSF